VFARRGMADAQLSRDEQPADAVFDEIAIGLGRKSLRGFLSTPKSANGYDSRGAEDGVPIHTFSIQMAVVHLAKRRSTMRVYHGTGEEQFFGYARRDPGVLSHLAPHVRRTPLVFVKRSESLAWSRCRSC